MDKRTTVLGSSIDFSMNIMLSVSNRHEQIDQ